MTTFFLKSNDFEISHAAQPYDSVCVEFVRTQRNVTALGVSN